MKAPILTRDQINRAIQVGCGGLIDEMYPNLPPDQLFALSVAIRPQVFAKERKAQYDKLERQADRLGNYGRIKR